MLPNEKEALYQFFKAVGERMHIHDIPPSLDAFEKWLDDYHAQHVMLAETNTEVGNATVNIVKGWIPFLQNLLYFL
jgi:hypothetical protein